MTTNNTEQKYLKTRSVADRYGVTEATVDRWMDIEGFPRPIRMGRLKFWKIDELQLWEEKRCEVSDDSNN